MTFLQAAAPLSEEVPKPEDRPLSSVTRRILAASEASAAIKARNNPRRTRLRTLGGRLADGPGLREAPAGPVAEELHVALRQHGLGWVTPEKPVASVSGKGTRRRGRYFSSMSDQQRAGLPIWSKAENIYARIELRQAKDDRSWRADLKKLARLVATYGRRLGTISDTESSAPTSPDLTAPVETAGCFGLRHRTILDEAVHCYRGREEDCWTCGAASVGLCA